jgi:hypothetical protein
MAGISAAARLRQDKVMSRLSFMIGLMKARFPAMGRTKGEPKVGRQVRDRDWDGDGLQDLGIVTDTGDTVLPLFQRLPLGIVTYPCHCPCPLNFS